MSALADASGATDAPDMVQVADMTGPDADEADLALAVRIASASASPDRIPVRDAGMRDEFIRFEFALTNVPVGLRGVSASLPTLDARPISFRDGSLSLQGSELVFESPKTLLSGAAPGDYPVSLQLVFENDDSYVFSDVIVLTVLP